MSHKARILFLFCSLSVVFLFAQKKERIEILNADELVYTKRNGVEAQRLLGNVRFKHQDALMYCDSAYLYKSKNELEAFGSVRINQGDTLNLYGDLLQYDGNNRIANVSGDSVKLINKDFELTTDFLVYNRFTQVADYHTGGVIESLEDDNVLSSKQGYYYSNSSLFFFKDSVILEHPDYTMYSDTLKYHSVTKMVTFLGPTTIVGDSNTIYCETGWYDTQLDISQYYQNAYIISDGRKLEGDTLYYDRKIGFGRVLGDIQITDTTENIVITGEQGYIFELQDSALVTEEAVLIQILDGDSMYMHADTFKVYPDSNDRKTMHAYHKVRIFKSDLQGQCDSIVYSFTDSVMQLITEPILWSEENQITGERIDIHTAEGKISHLYINAKAFIISEADSTRYNQIKGKELYGYFKQNDLYRVDVIGNGQTIYYGTDDKGKYVGVNQAESSDIRITLADNEIQTIVFINQPDAVMHPPQDVNPEEFLLKDFQWWNHLRPDSPESIFDWEE